MRYVKNFYLTSLAASTLMLGGCGGPNGHDFTTSGTKVIGGIDAGAQDFPEVVQITHGNSGCSASFVSSQTLVTAAHCLEGNSGPVHMGSYSTNHYYMHPGYQSRWWEHDVAIVHFDEPISAVHMIVAAHAPSKGDPLTIVGFGTDSLYGNGTFTKRYGSNTVETTGGGRIAFRGKDQAGQAPAGDDVLNASGDSGGPMLVGGFQVGVSSSISVEPSGQGRNGYYTDLNHGPNRQFLEDLVAKGQAMIDFQ